MLEVISAAIVRLLGIALKLATGEMTEDEARAECVTVGQQITEPYTDAELAEYNKLKEPPE
jgi:hypothetical protein